MSAYELLLSTEAERNIEDQLQWYEADQTAEGVELADRWMDLLELALETLKKHPERHGFAPENRRWMREISIRQMRLKPWKTPSAWRVLYVIDEPAKRISVLQIRHERRPLLDDGGH